MAADCALTLRRQVSESAGMRRDHVLQCRLQPLLPTGPGNRCRSRMPCCYQPILLPPSRWRRCRRLRMVKVSVVGTMQRRPRGHARHPPSQRKASHQRRPRRLVHAGNGRRRLQHKFCQVVPEPCLGNAGALRVCRLMNLLACSRPASCTAGQVRFLACREFFFLFDFMRRRYSFCAVLNESMLRWPDSRRPAD